MIDGDIAVGKVAARRGLVPSAGLGARPCGKCSSDVPLGTVEGWPLGTLGQPATGVAKQVTVVPGG